MGCLSSKAAGADAGSTQGAVAHPAGTIVAGAPAAGAQGAGTSINPLSIDGSGLVVPAHHAGSLDKDGVESMAASEGATFTPGDGTGSSKLMPGPRPNRALPKHASLSAVDKVGAGVTRASGTQTRKFMAHA